MALTNAERQAKWRTRHKPERAKIEKERRLKRARLQSAQALALEREIAALKKSDTETLRQSYMHGLVEMLHYCVSFGLVSDKDRCIRLAAANFYLSAEEVAQAGKHHDYCVYGRDTNVTSRILAVLAAKPA